MLKIGITSRIPLEKKENQNQLIHFVGDSILDWLKMEHLVPVVIPVTTELEKISFYSSFLDGLILQGGSDINPKFYNDFNEYHINTECENRDFFEIYLVKEFQKRDKPVLGICRGSQIINVVNGGDLYQDIERQHPSKSTIHHKDFSIHNEHQVEWCNESIFKDIGNNKVVSIHHQSVKKLGNNIQIEAFSPNDCVVEAIRKTDNSFVYGIQWHPELHNSSHMNSYKILEKFLKSCIE